MTLCWKRFFWWCNWRYRKEKEKGHATFHWCHVVHSAVVLEVTQRNIIVVWSQARLSYFVLRPSPFHFRFPVGCGSMDDFLVIEGTQLGQNWLRSKFEEKTGNKIVSNHVKKTAQIMGKKKRKKKAWKMLHYVIIRGISVKVPRLLLSSRIHQVTTTWRSRRGPGTVRSFIGKRTTPEKEHISENTRWTLRKELHDYSSLS